MILIQSEPHNLYLHQARDFEGQTRFVLVYGLETTPFRSRIKAVRAFAQRLDHAEECATDARPVYGCDEVAA